MFINILLNNLVDQYFTKKLNIMRKLQIAIYLGLLLFVACNSQNSDDDISIDKPSFPVDASGIAFGNVVLPAGTVSEVSNDGGTVELILPEGVFYLGKVDNELVMANSGCWSCSGSCTGCDVVNLGGEVGCTACKTGFIETCVGSSCDGLSSFSAKGGGLIDMNKGISIINNQEELNDALKNNPDWETLIQHPVISNEIDNFLSELWGGSEIDTENADLIPVNIFGTVVRLFSPKNKSINNKSLAVTCSCASGSSGCDYQKIMKGFIHVGDKCAANGCVTCNMSF